MYESSTKETKCVCIQLACSWRPRAFEEAHHWNIQAKFYNEKFPLVYESDKTRDSLYEEHGATLKHNIWDLLYHGATLKHKCGKRIVALPLLSFSLIFYLGLFSFLWPLFLVRSLIPACGGIIVSIILSSLGQCSNNDDHHTFIYLQVMNYNSILRTKYDSIWMPAAVYRDERWIKSDMYETIMNGGFATNTMSTTWSRKKQYDNDETCHNKRNGGKLHGNISRNGYGNAMIGRYGGCF